MIEVLLPAVLLISIVTLAVAFRAFRSSRRSEEFGADRYELLRDQQDRLELLREERQMLREELERESKERRRLLAYLEGGRPQFTDDLERERQELIESAQRAEEHEQERLRLEGEYERLKEELERERQEHLEVQRWAERLEREHEERLRGQQEGAEQHEGGGG